MGTAFCQSREDDPQVGAGMFHGKSTLLASRKMSVYRSATEPQPRNLARYLVDRTLRERADLYISELKDQGEATTAATCIVYYHAYPRAKTDDTESKFYRYAKAWKRETKHFSVIARRYQDPAYKAILELGPKEKVVALILGELRREPDRWFEALQKLTEENPAKDAQNFYEAVQNWISWGISEGIIE